MERKILKNILISNEYMQKATTKQSYTTTGKNRGQLEIIIKYEIYGLTMGSFNDKQQ